MSNLIQGSNPVVSPAITYDAWYAKSFQTAMYPSKDDKGNPIVGKLSASFVLVPFVSSTGQLCLDPTRQVSCFVVDLYAMLASYSTGTDAQKAVAGAVQNALGACLPAFQAIAQDQGKI